MKKRILLVDDEVSMVKVMQLVLIKAGYEVVGCFRPEEAIYRLDHEKFDLMITDLKLNHRLDGLDLIREARVRDNTLPIIMVTAYATIKIAVRAMKEGAYDFITKPFKMEDLLDKTQNAINNSEFEAFQDVPVGETKVHFNGIIGESKEMKKIYSLIKKVSQTNATILIEGESGTGKELVARAIHMNGNRSDKEFCAINCSSLSNSKMLDSQLFGEVPHGEDEGRAGLLSTANDGIVYLDGLAGMDSNFQSKMLRVMQNGVIRKVGEDKETEVDIRFIASCDEQFYHKKETGEFREDLYYRLSVIPIKVPPLRRRVEDIPHLVNYFCKKQSELLDTKITIKENAMDCLMQYSWPGNVRELENAIACAATLSQSGEIAIDDFPPSISGFNSPSSTEQTITDGQSLKDFLRNKEKDYVNMILKQANGNRVKAAEMLGISRASLYRKLES
jgi:DNA-binding NtrC family response regulator